MKQVRPIYSSDQFVWKGRQCHCRLSTLGPYDPKRFTTGQGQCSFWIRSERTGKLVDFYPVFDEDGYDGEMQVFNAFHEDGEILVTILND